MFQLAGRVAAIDTLDDGYAVMRLTREEAGLLGPEAKVLVPPLVMVRDGTPGVGDSVEVGAQSMAESGVSRRIPDCLLVARYIWAADGARRAGPIRRVAPTPARGTGTE